MYIQCARIEMYIEFVYYPPQGSSFYEHDMWEEIEGDLSCLPNNAGVLLMGDFNV